MGQITAATIKLIRAHTKEGARPPLTAWEIDQLATAWERLNALQPSASAEPLTYAGLHDTARALRECPSVDMTSRMLAGILVNRATAQPGCQWTYQDDPTYAWATQCGQMHVITDGTPAENDFKFCCYCGGKLDQSGEGAS